MSSFPFSQQNLKLNNSYAAPLAKETPDRTPSTEGKEVKNVILKVTKPEEEKPKATEMPDVQKKNEEKNNTMTEVRT